MNTPPDVAALANVGARLRAWRRFWNLSAQELADKTGPDDEGRIGMQSIYDYETGTAQPSAAKLAALCRGLNVSVAELLGPTPAETMEAERSALSERHA